MKRPLDRSPYARGEPNLRLVRNESANEADLVLYDEIGFWGVDARTFLQELQALDVETIHLRINSPGGNVFDGIAIANALKQHKARVVSHIDGLAASIASIIALAADEVRISENAFLMIHNAFTITIGNAEQLRKDAAVLDKLDGSLISTYVQKTGATEDQVKAWMKEETWFNADEAEEHGFIDVVDGRSEADAQFDLSMYAHAPAALARRDAPPAPKDLERALRDAGCSRAAAKAILAEGLKSAAPHQRDADKTRAELLESGRGLVALLTG
jgi:ATP-dependent Clp protease protease subunit